MRLKKIEIELKEYGDFKGKYLGIIRFDDGTADSFQFGLDPDTCQKFLKPISDQVVACANELGTKLATSFTKELNP